MGRGLRVVVVVFLLASAGCFGGFGDTEGSTASPTDGAGTPTAAATTSAGPGTATATATDAGTSSPTPTPTPTSTEGETPTPTEGTTPTRTGTEAQDSPTETTSSRADDLPPGVDGSGVRNVTALQEAHFDVLSGSSFSIDVRESRPEGSFRLRIDNGSEAVDIDIAGANATSGFYLRGDVVTRFNGSQTPPKVYSYGSTAERFGVVLVYGVLVSAYPRAQLTAGTFEVAGTVTRGGEELVRLRATGINETALGESTVGFTGENLTDMSGEILVRSDGLVRNMSLELSLRSGRIRTVAFSVSGIGNTTAAEPGWIDEAPQLAGALVENGTVFELRHTGGGTLPEGSTLSLGTGAFGGGLTYGNVTVPASVSPGDSLYLYATGSVGNSTVRAAVNEAPSPPSAAIDLSERTGVQVVGRTGEVRFVISTPAEDDLGL